MARKMRRLYPIDRTRLFQILEIAADSDRASRTFDVFIMSLIVLNSALAVLNTVEGLLDPIRQFYVVFEVFAVGVFTIEYLLRVATATTDARYDRPIVGRLKFILTPLAIIDLLSVLPFYLPFIGVNLTFMRVLRLVRLLKLGRYSNAFQTLRLVLRDKRHDLLTALLIVTVLIVFMSGMMYFAERNAQPDDYASIPESMWWSILALTGNGQRPPITLPGRLIGALVSVLGVGLFALPAGIIASGFSSRLDEKERRSTAFEDPSSLI